MTTAGTATSHGMLMTLPPSSTTTIGLPSAATCVDEGVLGATRRDVNELVVEREAVAVAGARVLLALVLGGEAGDDDDEVRVLPRPTRRTCSRR